MFNTFCKFPINVTSWVHRVKGVGSPALETHLEYFQYVTCQNETLKFKGRGEHACIFLFCLCPSGSVTSNSKLNPGVLRSRTAFARLCVAPVAWGRAVCRDNILGTWLNPDIINTKSNGKYSCFLSSASC